MKPVEDRLIQAADEILVAAGMSPFGFVAYAAKARIRETVAKNPQAAEELARKVAGILAQ